MVFSSITFLFFFLPVVLVLYYATKQTRVRNFILLISSLIFYAWGEGFLVLLMLFSCTLNYAVGLGINYAKKPKTILAIGVVANVMLLGYYKYFGLLTKSFNYILPDQYQLNIESPVLPIGISFFTFQGISYLIDIYRKESPVQKNIFNLSLYIALFPQLIAGPIVRYNDISKEISTRISSFILFNVGIKRFIIGLGKKVIIANTMGAMADSIFILPADELTFSLTWIGVLTYSLQIYFDFSGYSDMAIGLGKMFGFNFLENFNLPYISKSIQEFWRRWHISLSTWFRDYLYIPLGGNRNGELNTYFYLVIVFFTTGLWHGASWTYVFWGLYHGLFIVIERLGLSKFLKKHAVMAHIYTLLVVLIGWPFFRLENFGSSLNYIEVMFGLSDTFTFDTGAITFSNQFITVFILGVIVSTSLPDTISIYLKSFINKARGIAFKQNLAASFSTAFYMLVLIYSSMAISSGTYNPFIYFRF